MLKENIKSQLVDETIKAMKELTHEQMGGFLDDLYLRVNMDFDKYHDVLDDATTILEDSMPSEEYEILDNKLVLSKPKIDRPRSFHELTPDEAFEASKKKSNDWMKFLREVRRKEV
jgi:hypothetical protein